MAEQPNNVLEFPVPKKGTEFSSGDELHFHASTLPRNVGDPEAMARADVQTALGTKEIETIPAQIEQAARVGAVLAYIRPIEISDDAARKAA